MSTDTVSRVNYFEKQFLRVDEFRDEQLYQLGLRRRHNITQHTWGIVSGLELANQDGAAVVSPGIAIDGYGRELLLGTKVSLAPETFDDLATDRLDVWLVYGRTDDGTSPQGYGECGATSIDSYRAPEVPLVLLERPLATTIDPRRPRACPPKCWKPRCRPSQTIPVIPGASTWAALSCSTARSPTT